MFGIPRFRGFLKGIYGFPMNSSSVCMYGGQKAYGKVVWGNSRLVMGTGNFGDDGGVRLWDDEICHFNQMEIGFGDGYKGFQLECT